jgi:ATP-binding cassette subfamily B protein
VSAKPFRGAIRFREVSFWYEPERRALDEVSLEVHPGQQVALLGHSGGGKSTLVSLILRLYDPQIGTVSIDGRDIREYTLESLRSQISIVLQDSVLFAASVRDNIAYGAPNVTDQEVEAAARLANAHEFIEALPDGYDTFLGERGLTLSGGQRQRIAIARAAVRKAPILILDEPTTGLDRENGLAVIEALERLAHGHTAFLITHDPQLAANADRIVYLQDSRIVEFGTHDELVAAGGRYAAMLRLQDGGWDRDAERGSAKRAR